MQDIVIKIMGVGYNDINQANVIIKDINNNIIKEKMTYNGKVSFELKKNKVYHVIIKYHNEIYNKTIFLKENYNVYPFLLNHSIFHINNYFDNNITFFLVDENYTNLPIERGVLNLNG